MPQCRNVIKSQGEPQWFVEHTQLQCPRDLSNASNQALESHPPLTCHHMQPAQPQEWCLQLFPAFFLSFFVTCKMLLVPTAECQEVQSLRAKLGKFWKRWVYKLNVGLKGQQVPAVKKLVQGLSLTAVETGVRKQIINSEREMMNSTSPTHCCVLLHSNNYELVRFSYSRHPKFL